MEEMPLEEARKQGAIGVFENKYNEENVKVYSIGKFSKEICGGPHVNSTGELGRFIIDREESSSAGVRRIKAHLEKQNEQKINNSNIELDESNSCLNFFNDNDER